ncbi:MAG: hypothetical protein HZC41_04140 [Chloroflexi bacterium]|nr:hypothetical protein [Chloroflexota bacterium]
MSASCPNLEKCPIFRHFKEYAQEVYQEIYCLGDHRQCVRYQLRQAGLPVPENLLPHGGTLWDNPPARPD